MPGPQASPPARVQLSSGSKNKDIDAFHWLLSTRAGGDAFGPSTMAFDYFESFCQAMLT